MIWVDAHLSPRIAGWAQDELGYEVSALRDLGLRDAADDEIFTKGRESGAMILTKDKDFAEMVVRLGSPPKVIWLRCGNTSESSLKDLLSKHLSEAIELLDAGEDLVEIR
ncbi:MAG: DUF5615 family PIN-like protein [Akkermansiaceae bacterium]|nr:DUF5615 family PIN-like protein [Akkermansiaceae bacterium]